MSSIASNQLEEIHAMLASGHRSIRMECHTLVLWGLAAAFLILTTEHIFALGQFAEAWQKIVAANVFIAAVLFAVGVVDLRLTRRLRQARDESISFVQRQLTKVWWLLVGLIVVINIGMNFLGGGYLFYGICIILVGVALYIHGLFSQQMLTWGGIMLVVIGLMSMTLAPAYDAQKYLAASVFGLGLPLLSLMVDRRDITTFNGRRILLSSVWLMIVLAPAWLAYQWFDPRPSSEHLANASSLTLEQYLQQPAVAPNTLQKITLPAGTVIPFRLTLNSELLAQNSHAEIPLTLAKDMQLVVENGQVKSYSPDGRETRLIRISQLNIATLLSQSEGFQVEMQMNLSAQDE